MGLRLGSSPPCLESPTIYLLRKIPIICQAPTSLNCRLTYSKISAMTNGAYFWFWQGDKMTSRNMTAQSLKSAAHPTVIGGWGSESLDLSLTVSLLVQTRFSTAILYSVKKFNNWQGRQRRLQNIIPQFISTIITLLDLRPCVRGVSLGRQPVAVKRPTDREERDLSQKDFAVPCFVQLATGHVINE